MSEGLRAPPPLELIVALNLCLLPCCKTVWGLSDLSPSYLFLCFPSRALSFSFFCFGYWLIKVDILAHIPLEHVSGAGIKELPGPVIDFPLQRSEPPANNPQRLVICMHSSTVHIQRSKEQQSEWKVQVNKKDRAATNNYFKILSIISSINHNFKHLPKNVCIVFQI